MCLKYTWSSFPIDEWTSSESHWFDQLIRGDAGRLLNHLLSSQHKITTQHSRKPVKLIMQKRTSEMNGYSQPTKQQHQGTRTTKHKRGKTKGHSSLHRMRRLVNHLASYLKATRLLFSWTQATEVAQNEKYESGWSRTKMENRECKSGSSCRWSICFTHQKIWHATFKLLGKRYIGIVR
jgi:hypothetical protein